MNKRVDSSNFTRDEFKKKITEVGFEIKKSYPRRCCNPKKEWYMYYFLSDINSTKKWKDIKVEQYKSCFLCMNDWADSIDFVHVAIAIYEKQKFFTGSGLNSVFPSPNEYIKHGGESSVCPDPSRYVKSTLSSI